MEVSSHVCGIGHFNFRFKMEQRDVRGSCHLPDLVVPYVDFTIAFEAAEK